MTTRITRTKINGHSLCVCNSCERLHDRGSAPCPTCGGQESRETVNPYEMRRWFDGHDYANETAALHQARRTAFEDAAKISARHAVAATHRGESSTVHAINAITKELVAKYN